MTWIYHNSDLIGVGLALWAVFMLVLGALWRMDHMDEDHDAPID